MNILQKRELCKCKKDLLNLNGTNILGRRYKFISKYGWAIPSREALMSIKKFSNREKILEVGSGLGYWAFLLKLGEINIIATDEYSTHNTDTNNKYLEIERLSAINALQKYNDINILMLIWPPYDNPMAFNALENFKGNKLIYVGEGEGGCTADDKFHKMLLDKWHLNKVICIPTWYGIYDKLYLYELM